MYIQGRTVQKWANLIKSLSDEVHLLAGQRISRLKVPALLRCEMLASKQMHFASTITLIDDRP
ncbi:hypothetical protein MNBD_ALPHA08-558 [hydrothermal vent metagenome]|uniref:Uncharacterized protein n=1 Tax=hydrothermal vent metagenome TaxID=652676 RepID=A0A3B0R2U8_9ZZZZ